MPILKAPSPSVPSTATTTAEASSSSAGSFGSFFNVSSTQQLTFMDQEEEKEHSAEEGNDEEIGAGEAWIGGGRHSGPSENIGRRPHLPNAGRRRRRSTDNKLFLRRLFTFVRGWRRPALVLLPIVALFPLLLTGQSEFNCAFCVALIALYWTFEVMPLAVTALLPAVLFPMTGILSAREVSREFLNDTNFLFIGGLIVATAVEKCGLHERVALSVLSLVGSEPRRILLGFMTTTAVLSMFISNTATTAMMLPIGHSVIRQLAGTPKERRSARGEGNSGTGMLVSNGRGGEGSTSSTAEEGVQANSKAAEEHSAANEHAHSSGRRRMAKGLILSIAFAANIGGVGTLTGTPPNLVLAGMLSTLYPDADTGLNFLSWMALTVPLMLVCLFACWLILCLIFLRKTTPSAAGGTQMNVMIGQGSKHLPPTSFAQKSVSACFLLLLFLWIGRRPGFMPGFGDLLFPGKDNDFYSDATSAMLVSVALFLLPAKNPFIERKTRSKYGSRRNEAKNVGSAVEDEEEEEGGGGEEDDRLMDWPTMRRQFPWSVVLLLGGGFAMAAGVKESGLSRLMASALGALDEQPQWALQLICITLIMTVTNICSNSVTASIFIPIVSSIAQRAGQHPLGLMLPTTLACSFAFVLPVGSPPNALAFSSGLLKVSDMIVSGLAVSAATATITIAYLATIAPLMLPLDQFPEWAAIIDNNNGSTLSR